MRDLIALIRALVTLIRPTRHGRHHRAGPPPFRVSTPKRVEVWPAPEPIVMDGDDPRAYSLVRGPYAHVERRRSAQRAENDRRGIDLLVQIAKPSPALDDMAELRDLVRMAIAIGAVRR